MKQLIAAIALLLIGSSALAAKTDTILVCHVGNELGSQGETYMENPDCAIPEWWVEDYKCPDAGKIDLILVSENAKHIGNPKHAFLDDEDYAPLEGVGEDPADFEDLTVPPDGIDDGCEMEVEDTCPCFNAEEANAVADGEVTYCSFHPTTPTWASLIGTDGASGAEEVFHTAANPDPNWQRCSFDAVGFDYLYLTHLTLDEVAACYTIITDLIAAKEAVCQPFK